MEKKIYIAPSITAFTCHTAQVLMGSQFSGSGDNQNITPTTEEFSGEFSSRRKNVWDDEEEEEEEF